MDGRPPGDRSIDPAELLRGTLEKIVFFECRVSQLESELRAALQTAQRASADASANHRKAFELEGALAAARGAREESERRAQALDERVRLLEAERERLLSGLVEQARLAGAPVAEGDAAGEQADLAGFIAELRAEIEELRRFKASVEGAASTPARSPARAGVTEAGAPARAFEHGHGRHESVETLAGRLAGEGRAGLSARDTGSLRAMLTTESDRVLFEEALERLRATDPATRLRAVRRLEALGPKAAAPLLAAAVGREPDAEVKVALLGALARVNEAFAADLAAGALEDRRPEVRAAALDAFAQLAPGRSEPRVLGALGDGSAIVRRRAVLLLALSKQPQADDALAAALRDADGGVARAAAAALSGRPSPVAQQALARALEHADVRVRRSAAETLGRWTGERVDGDAPDHERRRAARRIAERLAAMAPAEVRSAVVGAAGRARTAELVVHRFTPSGRTRAAVAAKASAGVALAAKPAAARPSPPRPAPRARPAGPVAVAAGGLLATARTAVIEAPAATEGSALGDAIVAELRGALRGRATAELSELLTTPPATVEAALNGLAARGAVVARGPRWYVG